MKRKIHALILAGIVLFGLIACAEDKPLPSEALPETSAEATEAETTPVTSTVPETTAEATAAMETTAATTAQPEPLEFVSAEAEELYNLLMENKSVWEGNSPGGTLIDLDFDGTPEFITATHNMFFFDIDIFTINGNALEKTDVIAGVSRFTESIILRDDENGGKSWLIPYTVSSEDGKDFDSRLSLFTFSEGCISGEVLKFGIKSMPYNEEYDGYHFYYFYDENGQVKAPEEERTAFNDELKELIRQNEAGELEYMLPWYCGGEYPHPDELFWEELKNAFIGNSVHYRIMPNIRDEEILYWGDGVKYTEKAMVRLVNAYYSDDEDYLLGGRFMMSKGVDTTAACKPVIYLYPTEITDVDVRLTFPAGGRFTCTYPDYGDGWHVTAYPDGRLVNKADGYEYSYLYWEGAGYTNWDFSSGFVVKGSDTAAFLREKLSFLGLTPREYNEFIVYWLPLMQDNPYNLITFQTTAYEESAVLHVSPKPDSVLRVFMAYMPLTKPVALPEQELSGFEREGFAVIEWGGTKVG